MTKQIPLNNRLDIPLFALVDDADYAELSQYEWHLSAGRYAACYVYDDTDKRQVYMHRMIMNAPKGIGVDHVDSNGLHNTRVNLRLATQSQNNMNARPRRNSTSYYKGVYWNEYHQKWSAHIHVDGRKVYIGRYATQREAAIAYNESAKQHFGEYARLNEIVDDPADTPVSEPQPPKTSSYRGVSWDSSRQMWSSKIQVNKHTVNLGRFTDEIEAAKIYDTAAKIHHGDKAKLNFPA